MRAPSTAVELANYLLTRGAALGLTSAFVPRQPLVRAFQRLLVAFDGDCHLLVIACDHLLTTAFAREVGVSDRLLTPKVLDIAVRDLGGLDQPWRYLLFRRYARTEAEQRYYTFWLSFLEDARSAPATSVAQLSEERSISWAEARRLAMEKLDILIDKFERSDRSATTSYPRVPSARVSDPRVTQELLKEARASATARDRRARANLQDRNTGEPGTGAGRGDRD